MHYYLPLLEAFKLLSLVDFGISSLLPLLPPPPHTHTHTPTPPSPLTYAHNIRTPLAQQKDQRKLRTATVGHSRSKLITSMPTPTWGTFVGSRRGGRRRWSTTPQFSGGDQRTLCYTTTSALSTSSSSLLKIDRWVESYYVVSLSLLSLSILVAFQVQATYIICYKSHSSIVHHYGAP